MKHSNFIAAILFTGFVSINVAAQTKTHSSQTVTTTQASSTTQAPPVSKVDKKITEVDTTIGKAMATASRAKGVAKDLLGLFGSKTPSEGAIVIPSIEFDDAYLESLVAAVKDRKEVKKASVEYTDGTATIKIILRGKCKADFWMELPKELKEVFKLKTKQENNILIEYKSGNAAKQQLAQN